MALNLRTSTRAIRGFTLIETLVVIAIMAIIAAVAAPNLRAFVVRNKTASLSNEFTSALTQARALAVSKNSCVSVCVASASDSTTCAGTTTITDYQANGWLLFQNPACTATATAAATAPNIVLQQRTGEANGYTLMPTSAGWNIVMFDPRGYANLTSAGTFEIIPPGTVDATYKRRLCLDAAGRPTVRSFASTC